ncbi:unnamed protein product [Closterium sp. Naga37s-1]|nr:unnamed protein product [Closterium sp. Naga37s-1]
MKPLLLTSESPHPFNHPPLTSPPISAAPWDRTPCPPSFLQVLPHPQSGSEREEEEAAVLLLLTTVNPQTPLPHHLPPHSHSRGREGDWGGGEDRGMGGRAGGWRWRLALAVSLLAVSLLAVALLAVSLLAVALLAGSLLAVSLAL